LKKTNESSKQNLAKKELTKGNMVEKLKKKYLGKRKINKKEENSF
jgi:hypothetical protein